MHFAIDKDKPAHCSSCGCSFDLRLTKGKEIYPKRLDLRNKFYWKCDRCGAYVGCHPGTRRALGTPADAKLRKLRAQVHAVLDPFWKSKKMSRSEAYRSLALVFGFRLVHIGEMDVEQCEKAIAFIQSW